MESLSEDIIDDFSQQLLLPTSHRCGCVENEAIRAISNMFPFAADASECLLLKRGGLDRGRQGVWSYATREKEERLVQCCKSASDKKGVQR